MRSTALTCSYSLPRASCLALDKACKDGGNLRITGYKSKVVNLKLMDWMSRFVGQNWTLTHLICDTVKKKENTPGITQVWLWKWRRKVLKTVYLVIRAWDGYDYILGSIKLQGFKKHSLQTSISAAQAEEQCWTGKDRMLTTAHWNGSNQNAILSKCFQATHNSILAV